MSMSQRVEITGRVENGVVVLQGQATLPEGARLCFLSVCSAGSCRARCSAGRSADL